VSRHQCGIQHCQSGAKVPPAQAAERWWNGWRKVDQGHKKSFMRAAWKRDAKAGMAKLEKLEQWLDHEHPDAADSLREGMEECFTINRLALSWHRCLGRHERNRESAFGGSSADRRCADGGTNPWETVAMLATEKNFRRIMGHKNPVGA
jgi:hypothetical protein